MLGVVKVYGGARVGREVETLEFNKIVVFFIFKPTKMNLSPAGTRMQLTTEPSLYCPSAPRVIFVGLKIKKNNYFIEY